MVASKNFMYEGGKYENIDVHVLYDKDRGMTGLKLF